MGALHTKQKKTNNFAGVGRTVKDGSIVKSKGKVKSTSKSGMVKAITKFVDDEEYVNDDTGAESSDSEDDLHDVNPGASADGRVGRKLREKLAKNYYVEETGVDNGDGSKANGESKSGRVTLKDGSIAKGKILASDPKAPVEEINDRDIMNLIAPKESRSGLVRGGSERAWKWGKGRLLGKNFESEIE